jgi:transitional endoplasmic reticulum ATPase
MQPASETQPSRYDQIAAKVAFALMAAILAATIVAVYQMTNTKIEYNWENMQWGPTHWLFRVVSYGWIVGAFLGLVHPTLGLVLPLACLGVAVAAFTNHSLMGLWHVLFAFLFTALSGFWAKVHFFLRGLFTPPAREMAAHPAGGNTDARAPSGPRASKPTRDFSSIYGMLEVKSHLLDAANRALAKGSDANGILLFGEPGNGKTVFAEALAGELGKKWISLSIADIVSRWIGAGPEQLQAAFRAAAAQAPCVLFIDEADSVFASREGDGLHQDQINLTNVFLTEVVRLRGKGVLVIAATNSLDRLDTAAMRDGRFDFKVEITAPDYEARLGILREGLKRHAPGARVSDEVLANIAKRWVGFSVSRLLAVTKKANAALADRKSKNLDFNAMVACLRMVQGRKDQVAEDAKTLSQLVLEKDQRMALQGIVDRLKTTFETEQLGGSLPNGVLFWGPPGTGKTEAARAVAKESGWAFLTTTGQDLLAKPDAVDVLYRQAKDARPAIVFIDEADDVLGDRQYSAVKNITNKLLTVMEGVGGKVPDLLFIAATNHPSTMDVAVLRGGRFTEKVEFTPPSDEDVRAYVEAWLAGKGWMLAAECGDVIEAVSGQSIANITAMLQAAINLTIAEARSGGRQVDKRISARILRLAVDTVAPNLS